MKPTDRNQTWAIVLAAGEGTRLRELTSRGGIDTPKQFCSLCGGRSLLGDALARAARIVPRKRVVVVVAEQHRRFFERDLAGIPTENVVVQPRNKGTAAGILLPLLTVLERDPEARVAFLPSDHFVAKEYVIEASLRLALEALQEPFLESHDEVESRITLLGITPDAPETGYGWIVPRPSDRLLRPVARFVEKPEPAAAAELFASGALWNSFLFAAKGQVLVDSYAERLPELLRAFQGAFEAAPGERGVRLAQLYAELGTHDFSRAILAGSESRLRLELVPPCGWTDLGTPERVQACLAGLRVDLAPRPAPLLSEAKAALDLAFVLGELGATRAPALSA